MRVGGGEVGKHIQSIACLVEGVTIVSWFFSDVESLRHCQETGPGVAQERGREIHFFKVAQGGR